MGSLIGELEARQTAVRGRVEELEGQIAALTSRLEAERRQLERLTVTRETLDELAAEGIALEASASAAEPVGGGQVVGVQTVTVWREGMSSGDLPPVYRDIVDLVEDAPGPAQAKAIVPRIGLAAPAGEGGGTWGQRERLG